MSRSPQQCLYQKRNGKLCKYFKSDSGCHRGSICEYVDGVNEVTVENELVTVEEKEIQTYDCDMKEKQTQTDKVEKCVCKTECNTNKFHIEDDKVICVLKRAKCIDDEWKDYEEKVESDMDLQELLER